MRRTFSILASALVVVAGSALAVSVAEAETAPPQTLSTMDVCPLQPAPLATCFAKIQVVTGTKMAPHAAAPAGFGPADLADAYAIPPGLGAGRTVAIVNAFSNPNIEADLAVYRSTFGLPPCTVASGCLTIVNQDGATSPLPEGNEGWGMEMSLDADMVSATCPKCKILMVLANSNGPDALSTAVDTAAKLGANVISNSYGSIEFAAQSMFDEHYRHPGIPVVASAGDNGYGVSYPAASQYVTAVGGTSLTRTESGWSEKVWSGTGSGCSAYVKKPSWQTDKNCPMRMLNDVAAVADPATGVAIYDTYGQPGWLTAGGTSASAPIIAAMYAMTPSTKGIVGGETPWLNHAAGAFRDVTAGTNVPGISSATCGEDYLCTGATGYDGPTAWGTPQGLAGLTTTAG